MRWQCVSVLAIVSLQLSMAGCQQATDPGAPQAETSPAGGARERHLTTPTDSGATQGLTAPEGWKVYTPAEGDFSVMVPGDPAESSSNVLKMWKVRRYVFKKGEAPLVVELYSDRTGPLASDTVNELRDSSDIVPGTLRDVSLSGMSGIEFRTKGKVGEVVHREFCSPDRSRSVTLFAQKDVGGGLPEVEVRTFLDSFTLLR